MTDESQELIEFMYQAPVGLCRTDLDGAIEFSTPMAAQLLMPLSENADFSNIFDLFDKTAPELRNAVIGFPKKRGNILVEQRVPVLAADGSLTMMLAVTIVKLNPKRLAISLSNITALVEKEREAMFGTQMVAAIAENVDGYEFCSLDDHGRIAEWNASGEKLSGHDGDEVLGKSFGVLVVDDSDNHRVGGGLYQQDQAAPNDDGHWRDLLEEACRLGVARCEGLRLRKNGETFWAETTVTLLQNQKGRPSGYTVVTRETGKERARQSALARMAAQDPLTGALNRRGFFSIAHDKIKRLAARSEGYTIAVADLDRFKALNDAYGHAAGDAVLKTFVDTVRQNIRSCDVVGRLGGEEFAIFFPNLSAEAGLEKMERLRAAIAAVSVEFEGRAISFTSSFGVAASEHAREDLTLILSNADEALYIAKNEGRDCVKSVCA